MADYNAVMAQLDAQARQAAQQRMADMVASGQYQQLEDGSLWDVNREQAIGWDQIYGDALVPAMQQYVQANPGDPAAQQMQADLTRMQAAAHKGDFGSFLHGLATNAAFGGGISGFGMPGMGLGESLAAQGGLFGNAAGGGAVESLVPDMYNLSDAALPPFAEGAPPFLPSEGVQTFPIEPAQGLNEVPLPPADLPNVPMPRMPLPTTPPAPNFQMPAPTAPPAASPVPPPDVPGPVGPVDLAKTFGQAVIDKLKTVEPGDVIKGAGLVTLLNAGRENAPTPGPDIAGNSIADAEAQRQARLKDATGRIDSAFSRYGDDYFNGISGAYRDYYMSDLDRQFGEAKRKLPFTMPTRQSSAYQRQEGNLARDYENARTDIASQAEDQANQMRSAIGSKKQALYSLAQAGGDPDTIAQQAASSIESLAVPKNYSPLGDIFARYTTQALVNDAVTNGGGQTTRTGASPLLFGGRKNSVRVVA